MNFKRFHESKNLFDVSTTIKATAIRAGNTSESSPLGSEDSNNSWDCSDYIAVLPNTTYTVHYPIYRRATGAGLVYFSDMSVSGAILGVSTAAQGSGTFTFTTPNNCNYVRFSWANTDGDDVMFNLGESSLPYEPYGSAWHDIPHYIHNTSTDTLTTLPADIYANDNNATVSLKGNMEQSGTPTSTNPIQPQECGDLETSGTKAGQYKIPISSVNTTTPVYLGEVETTRRIKKLVLTGEEMWYANWRPVSGSYGTLLSLSESKISDMILCTHLPQIAYDDIYNGSVGVSTVNGNNYLCAIRVPDTIASSDTEFKAWLASEYSAGHPVTIWYVLATEETAVVNEPLRKIGNYADSVSGITIPTIAGANTLSIGTTLQPSEVTVNYKGWHPISAVHERENGAWT